MVENDRVLIAGGGPVGLVAALILARAGVPVAVFEAQDGPARDLRASTFHPPTLDMLDDLGLTGRLIEAGLIAPTWQIRDRKTGPVATFDMSRLKNDTNHPYRVQCEQWKLVGFVLQDLKAHRHAEVHFGHRVTGVRQTADGIQLRLGNSAGAATASGRYLIGADGANSAVRQALGVGFPGFTYEERFLSLSTPDDLADHFPDLTYINYISDPKEWLVLLRVKTLWRILLPTSPDRDRNRPGGDREQPALAQRTGPGQARIGAGRPPPGRPGPEREL